MEDRPVTRKRITGLFVRGTQGCGVGERASETGAQEPELGRGVAGRVLLGGQDDAVAVVHHDIKIPGRDAVDEDVMLGRIDAELLGKDLAEGDALFRAVLDGFTAFGHDGVTDESDSGHEMLL